MALANVELAAFDGHFFKWLRKEKVRSSLLWVLMVWKCPRERIQRQTEALCLLVVVSWFVIKNSYRAAKLFTNAMSNGRERMQLFRQCTKQTEVSLYGLNV